MRQIYPDLWQTTAEHPFPGGATHAYLLLRDAGNVLFYGSGRADDHQRIGELGGIVRQYLSHRDEVGPALAQIRGMFGSLLCCHTLEAASATKFCPVDLTFDTRDKHFPDIDVIPTPGHTDGSTSFAVTSSDGRTYLFTGDTIFPSNGSWETFVMPAAGGKTSDLIQSLNLLGSLLPDVVISSASVGPVAFAEMSPGMWRDIVDRTLQSLS